jgi:hypothetical protein
MRPSFVFILADATGRWQHRLRGGADEPISGGFDYFTHRDTAGVHDLWDGETEIHRQGYMTDLLSERAVAYVSRKRREPFLLSLHYSAPHWPWETRADEAEAKRIGKIWHTDGGERFSDTWPLVGKKMDLLEGGIRVPYIVRWPSRVKAGGVTEQNVITMDWVATFLEAAGVAPHPDYPLDGVSLLGALKDPAATFARERANYAKREPARCAELRAKYEAWERSILAHPSS